MNSSGPLNSRHIYKVAILVDWDNVRNVVFNKEKLKSAGFDNYIDYNRDAKQVVEFFKSSLNENEEIYRIYVYTAVPPEKIRVKNRELLVNRDDEEIRQLHKSYPEIHNNSSQFVRKIMREDFVAVRLGRVAIRLVKDGIILEQKQVGMLIGLDIAHLSYNKLVDRIIIFSYDSDMVPALKTARINGIQIVLPLIDRVVCNVNEELLEHTDIIRHLDYRQIVSRIREL